MLWYSRTGLDHALELLSKMDQPADWIWREFSVLGQLAMLQPHIATHEFSATTFIGNTFRGNNRQFIE